MPQPRNYVSRAVLVALTLGLGGCFPGYLHLSVASSPNTNQGTPLYILVRSIDKKTYLSESYRTAASRVVESDSTVLQTAVLYPGMSRSFWIKPPKKLPVGIYFFFTSPGTSWRRLIEPPLPGRLNLVLEGNEIQPDTRR